MNRVLAMNRVWMPFQLQQGLAEQRAIPLPASLGRLDWRRCPDSESLVAIDDELQSADTAIVARLADASAKLVGRSPDRNEASDLP